LFNDACVARLRLIGAATRAGLRLEEMRGLCRALDARNAAWTHTAHKRLEAALRERLAALQQVQMLLVESSGAHGTTAPSRTSEEKGSDVFGRSHVAR